MILVGMFLLWPILLIIVGFFGLYLASIENDFGVTLVSMSLSNIAGFILGRVITKI